MEQKRLIWNGKVPVRIVMGEASCFLLAARISYLPLYDAQISRYFGRLLAVSTFKLADGSEIPWHLPIGVIYDVHHGPSDNQEPSPFLELIAPTMHVDQSLAAGIDQVAMCFYGRLKEADALMSASSVPKVIPSILSAQQAAIFDTIVTGNLEKHMKNSPQLSLRKIALRVFREKKWFTVGGDPSHTVGEALLTVEVTFKDIKTVIAQGVIVLLSSRLDHLYKQLCHPDGFLYLILQ